MSYIYSFWLLLVLQCFQLSLSDSGSKLQIGIKKRVENCDIRARKGDVLQIHYVGRLNNGSVFDNSYERGEPLMFNLGSGSVILGWDKGVLGMCEGEKRVLKIPPELGYGKAGAPPDIPPDATLRFDVELVKIVRRNEF